MQNKGILTPEILESVWKSMSNKDEISVFINQNEPAVHKTLEGMKKDAMNILLKISSRKANQLTMEEIVDRIAAAFFSAGVLSTKLARDLIDQKEVPDINKYIKDFIEYSVPKSDAESVVSKRRAGN